jgi:hypothetical protein
MSTKEVMMRYATPFTTWLFMISLVSGVALFLHVGTNYFREMHEILSMLLIVPFVFHVWRNWGALLVYFRKSAMWIATGVSLAAAGLFVVSAMGGPSGSDPRMAVVSAINNASLAAVASLAKIDEATAVERLKLAGFVDAAVGDTIPDLVTRSGKDAFDILGVVLVPAT